MSEWLSSKRPKVTNIGKDVEKREPSYTVGGNVIGVATMENSIEVPHKTKNRTIMIQQFHSCICIQRKQRHQFNKIHDPSCSQQHYLE